jgi:hypothetical protein
MDLVSFVSALRNTLVEMGIQPGNVAAKGTVCSGRTLVRAARSTVMRRVGPYPLVAILHAKLMLAPSSFRRCVGWKGLHKWSRCR